MDGVRARLDADVDDGAGPAAEFGRGIGLHVELLDGVGGQDGGSVTAGEGRIGDALLSVWVIAIKSFVYVVVVLRLEAICAGRQASSAGRGDHAGLKRQQIIKVAAIH